MNQNLLKNNNYSNIQSIGRASGPSLSLLINELSNDSDETLIVIAENSNHANQLKCEIDFFKNKDTKVDLFPEWETLPYDNFSPQKDIVSERIKILSDQSSLTKKIKIITPYSLLNRLPPKDYLLNNSLSLKVSQNLKYEQLLKILIEKGYSKVNQVEEYTEFSSRGSLIDIFPMGFPSPARIEIYDDKIESIKIFDPNTQISFKNIKEIKIIAPREYPLDANSIEIFRGKFRELFEGQPSKSKIYRDISSGISAGGAEYFLPLFFESTINFLDYFSDKSKIILPDNLSNLMEQLWNEIIDRFEYSCSSNQQQLLSPEKAFFDYKNLLKKLKSYNNISYTQKSLTQNKKNINLDTKSVPSLMINVLHKEPSKELLRFISNFKGKILFTAESIGKREALTDFLENLDINARSVNSWNDFLSLDIGITSTVAPFRESVILITQNIAIISSDQIFKKKPRQQKKILKERDPELIIKQLTDLSIGSPVVHIVYGIGRFQGLINLKFGEDSEEFLHLEYADKDKLYVPVHSLDLISRYTGSSPENAPIHKLGSDQWSRIKLNAIKKIRDVAAELLDIYAKRSIKKGYKYIWTQGDYEKFENEFPFQTTDDQENAINSILGDFSSQKPMDRVICGDVGFGKTEVAMRATFIAALNSKQIIVLAPTTLLANQHAASFKDRFKNWPIKIELISRFQSQKKVSAINDQIKSGTVDIVIGTHRVLSHLDVFKNLGLVIVDEEHRFGVRHKEKIKNLKNNIDILTLTATPIPRTLNMAMGGIRELSLITTPPLNRLSIKTFVSIWDENIIREACQREIKRGGQIYFVHNRIEDIENIKLALSKIVPDAKIKIGHGKMRESKLEEIMLQFYKNDFNILLCTTIIESGLDIPNANTIIINRADRLGLAQLHQLRGRVGRSHHRAYAYLISPPKNLITADANKRLEAICNLEDLGSGFVLATHDLEIRGAGELLGDEQSGQIQQIGFSLYTDLLSKTIEAMKQQGNVNLDEPFEVGVDINLRVPCLLPADYVPDVQTRLILYKRISIADENGLNDIKIEMIDRFGLIPKETEFLFRISLLKRLAKKIGLKKISANNQGGSIHFADNVNIENSTLINLINSNDIFQMKGPVNLIIKKPTNSPEERFALIENVLNRLLI